eukprot:CAMPEP_0169228816 /NCGR_PEP_ID=MMETSP1016-20121227/25049_1 /TAXON_ID=342587 /ORGANISM="Karlodinium micrum, Strain CCMP2283" /LENGTH=644 /DNA_ID=CAMNT_0009307647 /DNA_START=45 /DNA_END=1979 /DNA_ORIENTATION=-
MSETAPKDGETVESEKVVDGAGEENPSSGVIAESTAPTTEQEDVKTDAPKDSGEATTDAPKHGSTEVVPESGEDPPGATEKLGDPSEKAEVVQETTEEVVTATTEEVVPATTEEVVPATTEEVVPATSEDVVPETADVVLETTEESAVEPEAAALTSSTGDEVEKEQPSAAVDGSTESAIEPTTEAAELRRVGEEGPPTVNAEEMSAADLTSPGEEGTEASPDVQRVEVPERQIDISDQTTLEKPTTAESRASEKMQAHADRLRDAVASAMAGISDDLGEDSDIASALSVWKAKLDSHVQELQGIVQQKLSPKAEDAPVSSLALASPFEELEESNPEQKADEILGDVANVRSMRQQLESHRTGRDVEQVAEAWADPEEAEKEVEELRRVRRQIRYLFGGMIGSLPDSSTNLKIDDLISDHAESEPLPTSVPLAPPMRPPGIAQSPRNMGPFAAAVAGMPEASRLKGVGTAAMESPRLSPAIAQVRPRSGGTESLGSVTNSSVATWNGAEDEERRRERKERKHRSRGREHRSVEPPRELIQKKDDGTMPSKQWNWAEEVVKASLDPGNQWEFPSATDTRNLATPPRAPRRGQPSWEQPRQVPRAPPRGQDIAMKARERAEEVIRSERDRHRNYFEPDMLEAASYR